MNNIDLNKVSKNYCTLLKLAGWFNMVIMMINDLIIGYFSYQNQCGIYIFSDIFEKIKVGFQVQGNSTENLFAIGHLTKVAFNIGWSC